MSPSTCSLCHKDVDFNNHLLLNCNSARRSWKQLFRAFGINLCLPNKFEWLVEALRSWHLKGKAKIRWGCAAPALLWELWKEQN